MAGNGKIEIRRLNYSPLPSQMQFLMSTAKYKGFSGPIGSGKSQALCQEAIRLSYVNAGRTGLLGAPTYQMLKDTAQRTLVEILDGRNIPYQLNRSENFLVMTDTHSTILFRAVEEFERLRGTNLAWFGLDELTYTPEEAWDRLAGRLRDIKAARPCGFAVWTPKGHDWVWRKFIVNPVEGYEVIFAKPFENSHVAKNYYSDLERIYDPRVYQQEVLGEYLEVASDRVYTAFKRDDHVKELQLDDSLPLRWSLDFNIDPMCSVIAQIRGDGKVAVLDEIFLKPGTTVRACEEFLKRYSSQREVIIYGDASGNHRQTTTGTTDFDMVGQYLESHSNMRFRNEALTSNPGVRVRVNNTNRMLRNVCDEINVMIDPRCKELILDLEEVSYDAMTCEINKSKDRNRTHLTDALGYLLWKECRPATKIGERTRRIV